MISDAVGNFNCVFRKSPNASRHFPSSPPGQLCVGLPTAHVNRPKVSPYETHLRTPHNSTLLPDSRNTPGLVKEHWLRFAIFPFSGRTPPSAPQAVTTILRGGFGFVWQFYPHARVSSVANPPLVRDVQNSEVSADRLELRAFFPHIKELWRIYRKTIENQTRPLPCCKPRGELPITF